MTEVKLDVGPGFVLFLTSAFAEFSVARPSDRFLFRNGEEPWLLSRYSTCVELTGDGPAEVVMAEYIPAE
jgi:hypothetical protein